MGQVTPNIGIYIPAAGETNYDNSFASGMVYIDQHDHSGGPHGGVPISSAGIAAGSITFDKLNANVADNTTGIGTHTGGSANQLYLLGILNNLYNLATATGFLAKNGTAVTARTLQQTANQISISNADGSGGDPIFTLPNDIYVQTISFNNGTNKLGNYIDNGTFVPGIAFGGTSTGVTYSTQVGFYTRIGNVVFYNFNIVLTSAGTDGGTFTITNLPIAQGATVGNLNHIEMRNVFLDVGYTEINSTSITSTTNVSVNESGSDVASSSIVQVGGGANTSYIRNNSAFRSNGFYIIQ